MITTMQKAVGQLAILRLWVMAAVVAMAVAVGSLSTRASAAAATATTATAAVQEVIELECEFIGIFISRTGVIYEVYLCTVAEEE